MVKEFVSSVATLIKIFLAIGWIYAVIAGFKESLTDLDLQICHATGYITGVFVWYYYVPILMIKTYRKVTAFVGASLQLHRQ